MLNKPKEKDSVDMYVSQVNNCLQSLVDKYKTLCIAVRRDKSTKEYECSVYNNGVKFVVGYDVDLMLAITKAINPIIPYIESERIPTNTELNELQITQIEKMMSSLHQLSCAVFINDKISEILK